MVYVNFESNEYDVNSKNQAVKHPVRVNPIPRQIPPGPKYLRPWVSNQTTALYHVFSQDGLLRLLLFWVVSCRSVSKNSLVLISFCLLQIIGAAFIELYFILSSLFASRAYYAFGFVALTASIVALTTATVTILFTYFSLCAEDYR
jgi:transmembrane 9 superfamily protein 2/4